MTTANPSIAMLVRDSIPPRSMEASIPHAAADDEARRIVAAIGRGDESAFRQLYDRYHQRLLRFALVLSRGDEPAAQDAVQSAFIVAAKKLRRIDGEKHLWHWLAQVTRQQLGKSLRKDSDHASVSLAEAPENIDGAPDSALEDSLDAALATLDPDDRQVVEWFYFDRLSHKDIADKLSATPKAVSSRLERIRARLKSSVNQHLSHET